MPRRLGGWGVGLGAWGGRGSAGLNANVDHLVSRLQGVSWSDVLQTATDAAQREVDLVAWGNRTTNATHTHTHTHECLKLPLILR